MKNYRPFQFKQFSLEHSRSALKVGVDATLLGAWCSVPETGRVMDVGTGCGIIALMVAQRAPLSIITGIDIDTPSLRDADDNISSSPFSERVNTIEGNFCDYPFSVNYHLIVSNPPFFDSGVSEITDSRLAARHQSSLPFSLLIGKSAGLLLPGGRLALILPLEFKEIVCNIADKNQLNLNRSTIVQGNPNVKPKRILIEWEKPSECKEEGIEWSSPNTDALLILESSPGLPTEEYRTLCRDFYLKF
ncbi:MAG: methyltransferase [Muribaculaceae bacterium]|nr:methyltransferase [Muribaculaceae bacterium]